jgi:dihydropteroate synthase
MTKLTDFKQNKSIKVKGKLIDLSYPKIMGILNLTPDSFYAKSRIAKIDDLLLKANDMISNGAEILDIGGVSTRPGAKQLSTKDELNRILKSIKILRKEFPNILISLDTYNSETAQIGLNEGVDIINDISSGVIDDKLFSTIAAHKCPYILTHSNGMADKKFESTESENIIQNLIHFFSEKINYLHQLGVIDIVIDPGFGFGKTIEQNFEILRNFEMLKILNKPILVGVSRKSMIYKKLEILADESINGTSALHAILLDRGANIFRVHDVQEMHQIRTLLTR